MSNGDAYLNLCHRCQSNLQERGLSPAQTGGGRSWRADALHCSVQQVPLRGTAWPHPLTPSLEGRWGSCPGARRPGFWLGCSCLLCPFHQPLCRSSEKGYAHVRYKCHRTWQTCGTANPRRLSSGMSRARRH